MRRPPRHKANLMMTDSSETTIDSPKRTLLPAWAYATLLLIILAVGAYLRFSGLLWGEYQYLHPDERFLVWVGTDISPVSSLAEYFDTVRSSLNPHNAGKDFYVYGTLPMFLTRYVVQGIFGRSGFEEMTQAGRFLSVLADLLTVLLVYLIGKRLYGRAVGLLAAAFSAAAVLQIQQAHFFTMDTFINAFSFLAFYFAAQVLTSTRAWKRVDYPAVANLRQGGQAAAQFFQDPLFLPSLLFGVGLGMAVASKINAVLMAIALPIAMLVGLLRLPAKERQKRGLQAFAYLAMAAVVSVLVFRICQPYAFSGPGFFGLKPNPKWVDNIMTQRAQSGGDVDYPPNMQWARRPLTFSLQNLVAWGLGWPYGLLAWAGFLWVGLRLLNGKRHPGEWQSHSLIWLWTAAYFVWQSLQRNPTMRYQLPIYPSLAIFAAWALVKLYDLGKTKALLKPVRVNWPRLASIAIGAMILLATFAYAFGFSRIYTRPITRVDASRWVYKNVPGPINLPIQTSEGLYNQLIPFPYTYTIRPGVPYNYSFTPRESGTLAQVYLPRIKDQQATHQTLTLQVTIHALPVKNTPLATATLTADLSPDDDPRGRSFTLDLDQPVLLDPEQTYSLRIELAGETPSVNIAGDLRLGLTPNPQDGTVLPLEMKLGSISAVLQPEAPFSTQITAPVDGILTQIYLGELSSPADMATSPLVVSLIPVDNSSEIFRSDLSLRPDPSGAGYLLALDTPIDVYQEQGYVLSLGLKSSGGIVSLSGMGIANEGDWDDGLPVRIAGYDGFGGIYPQELNFNMYWDDNNEKLARFTRILDEADYILISSSRQWGSLPRIPERFPMTTIYYRHLIGCPLEYDILYCYREAVPGMFKGSLGYELVEVFQSNSSIGPWELNDQYAEEAFTVYDHPKVFVFKKTAQYDSQKVASILGQADFTKIVRMPPMRYPDRPVNLMLPEDRLAEQRLGGTWSELFDTNAWQNRYQILSVLLWYLCVSLLGLFTYPLLRLALPGLKDGGYPMARTAGMLIVSYLVWLAGSYRIPFSRPTISAAILLLAALGALLAYRQRDELRAEFRQRGKYYLLVEGLWLAFFVVFLLIRWGNPDLWHPWKGGEKPMDFSYFNAVLKSTSFPPYDPWLAGGYLNYYYYGFVIVGTLVKWLGIVPAIAYNLIIPSLFAMIAMGAFSLAWNLVSWTRPKSEAEPAVPLANFIPAIAASLGLAVLGNLGAVRMIFQGYQKLAAPEGIIEGAGVLVRWGWAVRGFIKTLQGASLPYGLGDWYWIPSRAIPAPNDIEPITEFPFFTVLYADLHAHLIALPITLLALACFASILLSQARWKGWFSGISGFLLMGLAVGALRPTNTWDFYPYLVLGAATIAYTVWKYFRPPEKLPQALAFLQDIPPSVLRPLLTLGSVLLLVGLSFLLFQPYADWYAMGYDKVDLWKGTRTPFTSYLTHWGLFLFVIISWLVWETYDWLATTPASALRRLKRYEAYIYGGLVFVLLCTVGLYWLGAKIAWFALPLAAWAGVLLLRPGTPEAKRAALFLIGTGLVLTLMVEVIVLRGDIGRMNTVFKFYLQVWTFFAISAAAALGWLVSSYPRWRPGLNRVWELALFFLMCGAMLYPIMAGTAKVKDRISENTPATLNGLAYMEYSTYHDRWEPMDLSQDYRAIRWLQENVSGSPVIVEANLRDLYRWGSRMTINTGLPGVVGWEWHQQQQRAVVNGSWITERIYEIANFYTTTDWQAALDFLRQYQVSYIIVGQQERGLYAGQGLAKFEAANGILWLEVYRDGETVIYQVLGQ